MLKPQLKTLTHSRRGSCSTSPPIFSSSGLVPSLSSPLLSVRPPQVRRFSARRHGASGEARRTSAMAKGDVGVVRVRAIATIKVTVGGFLSGLRPSRAIDDTKDLIGKSLYLELVSSELDPKTGQEKETIGSYGHRVKSNDDDNVSYEGEFDVPSNFGPIGAVLVTNKHNREMFLEELALLDGNNGKTLFTIQCNSWVQAKSEKGEKRIFFANKPYLPNETPAGLQRLRKKDLELKRGNGQGERKASDRIYDYDVYNDLGDPDNDDDKTRPVLGGNKKYPYPRRCRTGRPRSSKDPNSETRSANIYVPRDEQFSEEKSLQFSVKTLTSVLHAAVPSLQSTIIDANLSFPSFFAIDKLFEDGLQLPKAERLGFLRTVVPRLLEIIRDGPADQVLLFDLPATVKKDKFSWLRDEEFARETLAGINPYAIELVKEFPLKSKLDPTVYGPPESALTAELLEERMGRVMTVTEAIEQKRLFMLDYHDLFLPYVHKIRAMEDTTMYGSRTVFFLTGEGTLKLLAIELTRPASPSKPQWKHVFTPSVDATQSWLWRMAKAHVRAHDSGHHELISHWLRTHCCVEPYIIAANRQLSEMHPIYQLLRPHFRYTMRINALARSALINGGGIIELSFSPLKYSMELSSVAYDQLWRFDMEALPADLIRRGMAVEDEEAEHGLRLTIEDYPFASDGLLIWYAIKDWVQAYVSRYYADASRVVADTELQAWWTEVRTKGHGDKKDAAWWPKLDTPESLTETLTTIIWVASAHHAAVNFGQYDYGGYFPNRPTIARINMPVEDPTTEEYAKFLDNPDETLRTCFPSQIQATLVMAVLDVLSSHSPDEEYLGGLETSSWSGDAAITAAYEKFNGRLKEIEGIIDAQNSNPKLKNRCGAGIVPYQLMKPFSEPGVTGKGIPNSTSI